MKFPVTALLKLETCATGRGLRAHLIQFLQFPVEESNPEMSRNLLKIVQLIRFRLKTRIQTLVFISFTPDLLSGHLLSTQNSTALSRLKRNL